MNHIHETLFLRKKEIRAELQIVVFVNKAVSGMENKKKYFAIFVMFPESFNIKAV